MFNTIPTCNHYKTPQGDIGLYPRSLQNPVSSQTHGRPHCGPEQVWAPQLREVNG